MTKALNLWRFTEKIRLREGNLTLVLVALALALLVSPAAYPAGVQAPSQPASLVLTAIPPKIPSDGSTYQALILSLLDAHRLPTESASAVTVYLSSSSTNIAQVPGTVTLPAGRGYLIINVTTTTTPGKTTITASSTGLASATAQVTTVIPSGIPSKIVVYASPPSLLTTDSTGSLWVELVDSAGLPSKAISAVTVALTSSDNGVVTPGQGILTVQPGQLLSAQGTFDVTGPGTAYIYGTSPGYSSGGAPVAVKAPGACTGGCTPSKLVINVLPATLPADGQTYDILGVSLETASGYPAIASTPTSILVTSAESTVATVPGDNGVPLTIPLGGSSALTTVTTSALAGKATLTATSSGLQSGTAQVTTVIPAPSKIQAYVAPTPNALSSRSPPMLVVQFQDSGGNPARARGPVSIVVTSSNEQLITSVINLDAIQGEDYLYTFLHVTGTGTTTLTASTQGLSSSTVNVNVLQGPAQSTLSPQSSLIYTNETATLTFAFSFLGRPLSGVPVAWTSSGGELSTAAGTTNAAGVTAVIFTPTGTGAFNVTASASSPQTGKVHAFAFVTVGQVPQKPKRSILEVIASLWIYIVPAAVAVAVAAFYVLRLRKKKQREEIEAGFEVA